MGESKSQFEVVGNSIPRVDGQARVTGEALFTDDIQLPQLLVGKILRSPHAHAQILTVDTQRAEKLPGVFSVITGADLPVPYGILPVSQDEYALALHKVRYIGEPVAAVAAIDEATALEALAAIEVTYEVLPAVLSMDDALEGSNLIHADAKNNVLRAVSQSFGPVEKGFEDADLVLERTYEYGASTHVALETHSALARWTGGGRLELTSSTQVPHYLHRMLSQVLRVELAKIRVIKPHVGAGFGGKSEALSLEFVAACLSQKAGRPVRVTQTREETFYTHRGRHLMRFVLKTGHKKDGSLTACSLKAWLDTGAYASFGVVTTWYAGAFGTLPYHLPAYSFDALSVYTNTPPAGPKRGHGALQPRFAFEVQLDEAAERLGLDPGLMRLNLCVESGHETINGLYVGSAGLKAAIQKVMDKSGWVSRRGALPPGRGLGLACSAYMSGASHAIYHNDMPHSAVTLTLSRSGVLTLFMGAAEIGQGSSTVMAMLVAEILKRPPESIRIVEADTDLTPVDLGSYSSRVTFMCGNAAVEAGEKLRRRLLDGAAQALKVETDAIEQIEGGFGLREGTAQVSFLDAIAHGETTGGPLVVTGTYRPPESGGSFGGKGAGPSPAYSFTAQVAEVDVDRDTGEVRIVKMWCAHDCGRAINPQGVIGQVEGSIYMGIGEALFESMPFSSGGLMLNPSILEYRIPTILDVPEIDVEIVESIDPDGPFGAKEAGEGPQLPTVPAITNAIQAATGVRVRRVPIFPDKLIRLLDGRKEKIALPTAPMTDAQRRAKRHAVLLAKRRNRRVDSMDKGGPKL